MSEQRPSASDRPAEQRAGDVAGKPGVPRWVKAFGIVVAALLLFMLLVLAVTGGQHGPGRHRPTSLGPSEAVVVAGSKAVSLPRASWQ